MVQEQTMTLEELKTRVEGLMRAQGFNDAFNRAHSGFEVACDSFETNMKLIERHLTHYKSDVVVFKHYQQALERIGSRDEDVKTLREMQVRYRSQLIEPLEKIVVGLKPEMKRMGFLARNRHINGPELAPLIALSKKANRIAEQINLVTEKMFCVWNKLLDEGYSTHYKAAYDYLYKNIDSTPHARSKLKIA